MDRESEGGAESREGEALGSAYETARVLLDWTEILALEAADPEATREEWRKAYLANRDTVIELAEKLANTDADLLSKAQIGRDTDQQASLGLWREPSMLAACVRLAEHLQAVLAHPPEAPELLREDTRETLLQLGYRDAVKALKVEAWTVIQFHGGHEPPDPQANQATTEGEAVRRIQEEEATELLVPKGWRPVQDLCKETGTARSTVQRWMERVEGNPKRLPHEKVGGAAYCDPEEFTRLLPPKSEPNGKRKGKSRKGKSS